MGIKSFLAARKAKKKTTGDIPVQVRDYMSTKLITFKSGERIENVIDGLIKHRISGAPVVNDKN